MSQQEPLEKAIERCRVEGREISDAIWQRIYDIAFRIARGRFRVELADAEEIGQEMMLRAIKQVNATTINSTWIYNGVRFLCIDRMRARRSETAALEVLTRESLARMHRERAIDASMPEMAAAVASLPAHCRELIRKYFFEGHTWAELDAEACLGRRCSQYETSKCVKALARALAMARRMSSASREEEPRRKH